MSSKAGIDASAAGALLVMLVMLVDSMIPRGHISQFDHDVLRALLHGDS